MSDRKPKSAKRMEELLISGLKEALAAHRGEKPPARDTARYKGYMGVAEPEQRRRDMQGTRREYP